LIETERLYVEELQSIIEVHACEHQNGNRILSFCKLCRSYQMFRVCKNSYLFILHVNTFILQECIKSEV